MTDPDRSLMEDHLDPAARGSLSGRRWLINALESSNPRVRSLAAEGLSRVGSAWAVEPLGKRLDDIEPYVRHDAIFALCRIGLPAVVPFLLKAEHDDLAEVREDARVGLIQLLGNEVAQLLGEYVEEVGEAERVGAWWFANASRFSPTTVYARGVPFSIERLIDQFRAAPAHIGHRLAEELFDLTGKRFAGSHETQVEAWQRWWRVHSAAYPPGKRYFHGRGIDYQR